MREVVISKQVPQEGGGFKIVSKKVSFSNNSVYFDILKDIERLDKEEQPVKVTQSSTRKSSRRK